MGKYCRLAVAVLVLAGMSSNLALAEYDSGYGNTAPLDGGIQNQPYGDASYGGQTNMYSYYGSTVLRDDGITYTTFGNRTFDNRGNSWTTYGNTVYGSDGSSCTHYGSDVSC